MTGPEENPAAAPLLLIVGDAIDDVIDDVIVQPLGPVIPAGEAFAGASIATWLAGEELRAAGLRGIAAAGRAITVPGARPKVGS